jgi:NitT/TauT family transport system permease protein
VSATAVAGRSDAAVRSAKHRRLLRRRSLKHFVTHDVVTAVIGSAAAVVVWQLATLVLTERWLPTPAAVAGELGTLLTDSGFRGAFTSSLAALLIGFFIALVLGTILGIAMAVSQLADHALRYYVDALLIVPPVVLAPVLIVVFGITQTNVIAIVSIFAVAIIAINSASAVRGIDDSFVEVGRMLGANRIELLTRILMPAMLPQFFAGLHLGVTRAFKGMIVGQVFLGVIGIGGYLARFQQGFNTAGIWSIAIILISLALLLTWTVKAIDHVVNFWSYRD